MLGGYSKNALNTTYLYKTFLQPHYLIGKFGKNFIDDCCLFLYRSIKTLQIFSCFQNGCKAFFPRCETNRKSSIQDRDVMLSFHHFLKILSKQLNKLHELRRFRWITHRQRVVVDRGGQLARGETVGCQNGINLAVDGLLLRVRQLTRA